MHMDEPPYQKEKLSLSMSATNFKKKANWVMGQQRPKSVGKKTKYEPIGDAEFML